MKQSFCKHIFFRFQVTHMSQRSKYASYPICCLEELHSFSPPKRREIFLEKKRHLSLSVRRNIHFSRSSSSSMDSWKCYFFQDFFSLPQKWWCEQGSLYYPFLGGNHSKCMKFGLVFPMTPGKRKGLSGISVQNFGMRRCFSKLL